MNHNFWYEYPSQLIDPKYILNLIPKNNMTKNEKLNCIVRLSILIAIVLIILTNNGNYLMLVVFTLIITYIIWNYKEQYDNEKKGEGEGEGEGE